MFLFYRFSESHQERPPSAVEEENQFNPFTESNRENRPFKEIIKKLNSTAFTITTPTPLTPLFYPPLKLQILSISKKLII